MGGIDALLLKIKRGENPFFRQLRAVGYALFQANLPVPRVLRPALAFLYNLHFLVWLGFRTLKTLVYSEPLFRARCEIAGKRLHVALLPRLVGHPRIRIGNDVKFHGRVTIIDAGGTGAELIIEDGAQIGHLVTFVIARQIIIRAGAGISSECFVTDTDSPVFDAHELAIGHLDAAPVDIGEQAWVGHGSSILKGVKIGAAAMVGVGSVVAADVPDHSVAMGNVARIVKRARPEPVSATTLRG
ncbi:MAG: acyltransferase [Acidobacteriaceae bacterium]|nr:acyltransferase [Acidobacteriaceae bacterium]